MGFRPFWVTLGGRVLSPNFKTRFFLKSAIGPYSSFASEIRSSSFLAQNLLFCFSSILERTLGKGGC